MSELTELYQDIILDHSKNPRNFRKPTAFTAEKVGHNPLCGDRLILWVNVDENGIITDAAFEGTGCAISLASASLMTEMVKGKNIAQAQALFDAMHNMCTGGKEKEHHLAEIAGEDDMLRMQALAGVRHYPMRVKCATLAWHTLIEAIKYTKST